LSFVIINSALYCGGFVNSKIVVNIF
jgi:hypothetical protein